MKDKEISRKVEQKRGFWSSAWKLATGNLVSTGVSWGFAALAVDVLATGGAVSLATAAIASFTAASGAIKTAQVVNKTIQTKQANELNDRNTALVEYAQALNVQQTMLKLEPKLRVIKDKLYQPSHDKLSSKTEHTLNVKTARAENILNAVSFVTDVASIIVNPAKVTSVAEMVNGETIGAVLGGVEAATLRSIDTAGWTVDIVDACKKSPALQEELVNRINAELKRQDVGFDNLTELREQVRQLNVENKALQATLKEPDFFKMSQQDIEEKFNEKCQALDKEIPQVEKESGIGKAIIDTFNPFHERETKQHAGLTVAARRETQEVAAPTANARATKDDMEVKKNTFNNPEKLEKKSVDDIDLHKKNQTIDSTSVAKSNLQPTKEMIAELKKWQAKVTTTMNAKECIAVPQNKSTVKEWKR